MPRAPAAVLTACLLAYLSAQTTPARAPVPPGPPVLKAEALRPVLDGLKARCIGPANMGGRIADLAVVESDPDTYYVASAGGGVWKTTDGGTTFAPVTDSLPTQCIGSVAVCQGKPEVVYVGTGEGNPRNSVSWGGGVFRSTDGGKTWKNCGLSDTHHIGRVVVHPTDPDVAYVAATGHFWGPNRARGMYKTTDGGKTWDCVKFLDEDTGFVDACMDPSDPDTLYATAWQVRRDAFSGGSPRTQTGPSGGVFRTTDAGKTWEKLTGGLPEKVGYGRCGVCVYRKDPNVVFAVVQTSETAGALGNLGQPPTPAGKDGKPGTPGKIETGGVFRSDDKGKTWVKINDLVPRPFYYGQIRVDPADDKNVYVPGVAFYASTDGGKIFTTIARTIHADNHALWINPKNPEHLIVGNDGGLYVSKDRGKTFDAKRGLVICQFYGVAVDMRAPYHVYGGLQDNGSWGGPVATPYPDGVTQSDWKRMSGGDGFQAAVDPTDPNTVYVESQYGNLMRVDPTKAGGGMKGGGGKTIRPGGGMKGGGGGGNRFNWNAPMLLSPHDSKTLYYGSQFLYKTTERGDKWEKISPDLTAAPPDAKVTNSGHTILATAESPVKQGVLWVGTDDGKVWVSKTDGKDWTDVTDKIPGVPKARAIPKIECSYFDAGTAYVAIDRHRNDDFKPYIFLTTDCGETWKPVAGNLPPGAVVGVVRQSSKVKDLLFAGTELGLYASFDGGRAWHHLDKTGLPKCVRVDDLVIHARERDLVIGTHGRGAWVMDIAPLEQITEKVLAADAHLFDIKPVTLLKEQKRDGATPKGFAAANPKPGAVVHVWLREAPQNGNVFIGVEKGGKTEYKLVGVGPGLHTRTLDLPPGEHSVTLTVGDFTQTKKVTVKAEGQKEKKIDE
jgi:photosystem II stability/assembly factor-like uncharacterized protein